LVLLVAVAVAADTVLVTTAVTVRTAAEDAIAGGSMESSSHSGEEEGRYSPTK